MRQRHGTALEELSEQLEQAKRVSGLLAVPDQVTQMERNEDVSVNISCTMSF